MIKSNNNSTLQDLDGNKIMIENFEYQVNEGLFRSIGNIEIQDVKNNKYNFLKCYIDTKTNTWRDSKAFINDENFKINKKNNPRIFLILLT